MLLGASVILKSESETISFYFTHLY